MQQKRWAAWGFVVMSALGCGGDDKENAPEPPPPEEVADAGPAPFTCAGEVCELPEDAIGELCCADQFTGGCGVLRDNGCRRITKRDDRCPAAMPPGPSGSIPCCAPNGECGLDLGIGIGCASTSQNCSIYPREIVELLGSMTCEGEELELPEDCGIGASSDDP
jgi:hypothetical protein